MFVEVEDDVIEFPDNMEDSEIESILQKEFGEKEEEQPNLTKLEPGTYQDDDGNLFKVDESGEVNGFTEGQTEES